MRINGQWQFANDGGERPIISGEVLRAGQSWWPVELLIDAGADRTVLSGDVLRALQLGALQPQDQLAGVGGLVESVTIQTEIQLPRDDGGMAKFRGHFSAFPDLEALDMSLLGRDILDLFAVIVDRPGDVVCLLSQRHYYVIQQQA